MAMEQVMEQQQQQKDIDKIVAHMKTNPLSIKRILAVCMTDWSKSEKLYRGINTLSDVPGKHIKNALSRALGWEKSEVCNLKASQTDLQHLFWWGSGKKRSWSLPEREMYIEDFVHWYQGLHTAASSPLSILEQEPTGD